MNDSTLVYWCEKCGFHFEWPHVQDHEQITHEIRLTIDNKVSDAKPEEKP